MSIQNWEQLIEQEEAKGTFDTLRPYLDQAYKEQIIYPAKENIFRALEMTPLDKVRVVILGQDPYHGPNQAQGFSFSVPANEKIPPSLRNIYQEIFNEYQTPLQRSGDLSDWASQGFCF